MIVKNGIYSSAHDPDTVFEIDIVNETQNYVKIVRIQGGSGPIIERSYFGWMSKQRFATDYRFIEEISGKEDWTNYV